jgi:RNA polymerase-binding transcription factor
MELRERLESELRRVLERIRRTGSETGSGPSPVVSRGDPVVDDEPDAGLVNADYEITVASRSLLIERARRLTKALERFDRGGYGACQECGRAIGAGRLRVMPEATTCFQCQEKLERTVAWG